MSMNIDIQKNGKLLGIEAGKKAASIIRATIAGKGAANIILATGASQFETLKQLATEKGIDWGKVVMFHLDEYIGLPEDHKASFRKYLRERFLDKLPDLKNAFLIDGEINTSVELERLNQAILSHPIDLALVGIGENGHLAFNDPPADFEISEPYIVAELDLRSRQQQVNEGWFDNLDQVPKTAISMSIKQIMQSDSIICSVPDLRKAPAVRDCFKNEVSTMYPSSILQLHHKCFVYLEESSASLL